MKSGHENTNRNEQAKKPNYWDADGYADEREGNSITKLRFRDRVGLKRIREWSVTSVIEQAHNARSEGTRHKILEQDRQGFIESIPSDFALKDVGAVTTCWVWPRLVRSLSHFENACNRPLGLENLNPNGSPVLRRIYGVHLVLCGHINLPKALTSNFLIIPEDLDPLLQTAAEALTIYFELRGCVDKFIEGKEALALAKKQGQKRSKKRRNRPKRSRKDDTDYGFLT